MTYKFKIENDDLSQTDYFDGVSGNKNVYLCEFEINCDESGAVWFAVFKKGAENYITPITDGKCAFPYECLNEPCDVYLGCYAECEENKRISTNWLPLKVENGAYSQGTAPDLPSRDLWETLLSNSVPVIGENGHWFTYDMQEQEYADTGFDARGERGEKGDKGDKGDAGEQGIQGPKGEQGIQGPKGDKGDKGDAGEAGYTPQKGVDYFTQADIAEIAGNVDIADKLTEPSSGIAVGKYFRVASIDNDGHAVLEYADAQPAWRKICDYTLEEDVANITINKDSNNEPFVLSRAVLQVISPVAAGVPSGGVITGYVRLNGDSINYGALIFGRSDYKTIARAEVITDDDFMTYAIISESSYPHGASNIKSNLQICYGEQAVNHKKITRLYMFAGTLRAGTRVIVWGIDK